LKFFMLHLSILAFSLYGQRVGRNGGRVHVEMQGNMGPVGKDKNKGFPEVKKELISDKEFYERFESSASLVKQEYPYITLTYAQSLDGSISAIRGKPLLLSGKESLVMTHRLRACHDGIMVGVGTLLADNPSLTTRLVPGPA